jgi:streptogramin lyase
MGRRGILLGIIAALTLAVGGAPASAIAGPPVGIARSFPTKCGVESIAAGHEGNVWFACVISTNYGYGSREKVGRVTPAGVVTEFGGPFPKNLVPGQIVTAANGDLWFPLSSLYSLRPGKRLRPVLAQVTPSGAVTVHRPPGLTSQYNIVDFVASPNGYLWFTATYWEGAAKPSLWQISPDGTITQLPVDLGESRSVEPEVGPEGGLWFTKEPASGPADRVIARLNSDGTVTEFGTTIPGFSPEAPVLAPDGAFWFLSGSTSTSSGLRLPPTGAGRIAAGGEITDTGAKLDTAGGILGDSVVGSDGNLWFSFQSGAPGQSAIERVTPSGEVTPFRDCLRYSQPFFGPNRLARGADGNVWFTSIASRLLPGITDPPSIGRITPAGEINQIYAGVKAEPAWIAAGPDGAIWFSAGYEEIQRIAPINAPVNTVHVGSLRRTARSGASTLRIAAPGPGTIRVKPLSLLLRHHRQVALHAKPVRASTASCATARLPVKPVGPALRAFRKHGDAIERVAVTFAPVGGTPYTATAKLDFYNGRLWSQTRHSGK